MFGKMLEMSRFKKYGLGVVIALGLGLVTQSSAHGQLIESWEGALDGWQVPSPSGTNTTYTGTPVNGPGVTDGAFSLAVGSPSTNPNYSQMLLGPATMTNTAILENAQSLSLDIYTPPASFGFFLQFDFDINNSVTGFVSLDGFSYPSTVIGTETTLTVPISPAIDAELASFGTPTTIIVQIGGGFTAGNETMYLDNLRATPVPEPASIGALGSGLAMLTLRRRRRQA